MLIDRDPRDREKQVSPTVLRSTTTQVAYHHFVLQRVMSGTQLQYRVYIYNPRHGSNAQNTRTKYLLIPHHISSNSAALMSCANIIQV
jgi:hypothetical protein